MTKLLKKKRRILSELEAALDPGRLEIMHAEMESEDGSQFRPKLIEFPSHFHVLKVIQQQESECQPQAASHGKSKTGRSARLTGSVGINMGLDLEMRQ